MKVSARLSSLPKTYSGESHSKLIPIASFLNVGVYYSLLALIILTAVPYGTVEPRWESIFESVILTLAGLWIVEGLISGSWHLRDQLWIVPLSVLTAFMWVQAHPWGSVLETLNLNAGAGQTISADPYETRIVAQKAVCLILFFALLMRFTCSRSRLFNLVHVVISVGVGSALFGLVRHATQIDGQDFVLSELKAGVGFGQFINRNHFAFLMEMSLGLVICLILSGSIRRELGAIYVAAAVVMWAALILTTSRGGILSMLAQSVFIGLMLVTKRLGYRKSKHKGRRKNHRKRLIDSIWVRSIIAACLLITLGLIVLHVGGDSLSNRLEKISREVTTEGRGVNRLIIWQATWRLIKAHPVAGVGFGAYNVMIPQYLDSPGNVEILQAHNDYLELLASGGIISLLFAAWFIVNLIRRIRQQWGSSDPHRRALSYGALAGLLTVTIHSLFDFGLHITVNALVLIALMVILTANIKNKASLGGEVGGLTTNS